MNHARKANVLERQVAQVNVIRLRHLDEAERIADPDLPVFELTAKLPPDVRIEDSPRGRTTRDSRSRTDR